MVGTLGGLGTACARTALLAVALAGVAQGQGDPPAPAPAQAELDETAAAFADSLAAFEVPKTDVGKDGHASVRVGPVANHTPDVLDVAALTASIAKAVAKADKLSLLSPEALAKKDRKPARFLVSTRIAAQKDEARSLSCIYVSIELVQVATRESRLLVTREFPSIAGKRVDPSSAEGQTVEEGLARRSPGPREIRESAAALAQELARHSFPEKEKKRWKDGRIRAKLNKVINKGESHFDMAVLTDRVRSALTGGILVFVTDSLAVPELKDEEQIKDEDDGVNRGELLDTIKPPIVSLAGSISESRTGGAGGGSINRVVALTLDDAEARAPAASIKKEFSVKTP